MKNNVNYTGIALIILCIGFVMCFLCFIGYDTYVSVTKEKIEVQAVNSNSVR